MAEDDRQMKLARELRERVCNALKIHRDLAARSKHAVVVAKMNELLAWLEQQADPGWWIKNQKSCDSSVGGINTLWRDYQLDTFGEVMEREIVLRI